MGANSLAKWSTAMEPEEAAHHHHLTTPEGNHPMNSVAAVVAIIPKSNHANSLPVVIADTAIFVGFLMIWVEAAGVPRPRTTYLVAYGRTSSEYKSSEDAPQMKQNNQAATFRRCGKQHESL